MQEMPQLDHVCTFHVDNVQNDPNKRRWDPIGSDDSNSFFDQHLALIDEAEVLLNGVGPTEAFVDGDGDGSHGTHGAQLGLNVIRLAAARTSADHLDVLDNTT
jgi:hypothetical protein